MLRFVLKNSVLLNLLNLLCVWIEFLTLEHILLRCVDSEKDVLRRSLKTFVREYLVVWKTFFTFMMETNVVHHLQQQQQNQTVLCLGSETERQILLVN